jgi:hypothetical protein
MPGGDRTGPRGLGPMTGRGLGSCYGPQPGGWSSAGYGRFGAFGFGRGRGWRHRYYATGLPGWAAQQSGGDRWTSPGYRPRSDRDELGYLKEYTAGLEEELNALRARMAELEGTEKPG